MTSFSSIAMRPAEASPALHSPRYRRSLSILLTLTLVSGCKEMLVSPAPGTPAGVAIAWQIGEAVRQSAAANGAGEAFDKADAVRVRVERAGASALDTTLALPATGAARRVGPLTLEMRQAQEQAQLSLAILHEQAVLFQGSAEEIQLRSGTTTEVEVSLTAVPAGVVLPEAVPDLTSLRDTLQLTGAVVFATGDEIPGLTLTWSSLDPEIADVTPDGGLVALARGDARVVGQFGDFSETITVRVRPVVASLTLEPGSALLEVDETVQLTAVMRDARANPLPDQAVDAWVSSHPIYATVDGNGRVRGVAPGTATITASFQGIGDTATITVVPRPVASVEVTPQTSSIEIGDDVQLSATLRAADGTILTGREVGWSSSNTAVATVDGTGKVLGIAPGTATISAASEGVSGTASVTVVPKPVHSVEVSPATATIEIGDDVQLSATLRAADGTILTGREVGWSSSNTAVATVDGTGKVLGVAPGTATISAASEGVTGTAQVTVIGGISVVYGTVQDFQSQAPIGGASVVLTNLASSVTSEQTTDPSGRYRFENLLAGTFRLDFAASGHVSNRVDTLTLRDVPGGDVARIDVALPATSFDRPVGGFAGRAMDPAGQPIADAAVMLSGGAQTNGVFMSTNTASDGTYSLTGVVLVAADGSPIESFTVIVASPGRRTESRSGLAVQSARVLANVDFVLQPGESVVVYFADGFEGELGWSTTGMWNRSSGEGIRNLAVPTYVRLAPDDSSEGDLPAAPQGNHYMWYGSPETGNFIGMQEPGDPPGSGGTSVSPNQGTLRSPAFTIPSLAERATLTFTTWFEIESVNPNAAGFDLMIVSIEDDADGTVTELIRLNPFVDPELPDRRMIPFTSGGFNRAPVYRPVPISIDAFRGKTVRLRFHFDTIDRLYNGFRGWIIDDVVVSDVSAGTPTGLPTGAGLGQGRCSAAPAAAACRQLRESMLPH